MFNFLRHCQMVFQSDGTISLQHQKQWRVPVPPYLNTRHYQSFLFYLSQMVCVVVSHHGGFNCTSLTTNDLEYLLLFLFAIQISSLLNYLFKSVKNCF